MSGKCGTSSTTEIKTFDDYICTYFPSLASAKRNADITDPYNLGVEMAKDSLGRFGADLASSKTEKASEQS